MTKKKLALTLILLPISPLIILILLVLLNSPNIINDATHRLTCENTLKAIWHAVELYRRDNNDTFPPTLVAASPYMDEEYGRGRGNAPSCPGSRGDDETSTSSDYVYRPPFSPGRVVPVCWDGTPHRCKGGLLSDTFTWNVLYSDGHVGHTLDEKFIRGLSGSVPEKVGASDHRSSALVRPATEPAK
jgi:hypothetical protein